MPLRPLVRGLGGQVLRGPAAPRRAALRESALAVPIHARGSEGSSAREAVSIASAQSYQPRSVSTRADSQRASPGAGSRPYRTRPGSP